MILFHSFKHHLISIREWLRTNTGAWNNELQRKLLTIGSSQLDLYTGQLSVASIEGFVTNFLQQKNLLDKQAYKNWIYEESDYKMISLPDDSNWTLRFLDEEQFAHLHPSRYSLNTIRVKANVLKSCLCVLLFEKEDEINNAVINHYRKKYLQLPPVNEKFTHAEIEKVLRLLAAA
ncbi:hypothetical protein QTN47_02390 [Danxiaibacter flavus]|uniref:Uncharacterized protein n=1 Tax=Danxiaibacter flavus TaxID=3049108 RepID=A0ABV3Z8Y1_9BACT|nr:hypothetical protein QNM32_02390 [Chitinophagaceae bacterium DXS]